MKIVLEIVITILITDFVSGLLHWFEDAYGQEDWPITGRLITRPNILHHHDPRYFTRHSWLQSSWDLMCLGAAILGIASLGGFLSWQVWLFVIILGSNANQIHKWAHRTPADNGPVITFLQRIRLLQTPRHHAHHHTNPKESHYCVLTNFLNPILDNVGLWHSLERLIWKVFRVRRRVDTSVSNPHSRPEIPFGPANSRTNFGNWQLSQSAFDRSQKSRTI
jgi:plasmanylethanolamine desaturase